MANRNPGQLYGVGIGPGDPELVTLKAKRVLDEVSIIFTPRSDAENRSYARSIISKLPGYLEQKTVDLIFPMQKGAIKAHWEKATEAIWQHIAQGENCAFVTEGDPLLYGTFSYILALFQQHHPEVVIEVIPGISSVNAASARALLPLASGSERVAILPAIYEDIEDALKNALEELDTVVLLKVHTVFDRVLNLLEEMKITDQCVYINHCSSDDEEIIRDIRELRGQDIDYLSLLIIRR